jgi:hypothetical protein
MTQLEKGMMGLKEIMMMKNTIQIRLLNNNKQYHQNNVMLLTYMKKVTHAVCIINRIHTMTPWAKELKRRKEQMMR